MLVSSAARMQALQRFKVPSADTDDPPTSLCHSALRSLTRVHDQQLEELKLALAEVGPIATSKAKAIQSQWARKKKPPEVQNQIAALKQVQATEVLTTPLMVQLVLTGVGLRLLQVGAVQQGSLPLPWQTSVHQVPSLPQPQCMLLSSLGYPLKTWATKPQCALKGGRPLVFRV
jgi:hypothetical protein